MIGIIDYGMGNLKSIYNGMEYLGYSVQLVTDPDQLLEMQGVILPGVGAFSKAMENLKRAGFIGPLEEVVRRGTPLLGICLGMQLLFERGYEGTGTAGLGLLPGEVRSLEVDLKVPHMGWNQLICTSPKHPLWQGLSEQPYLYFVHSFALGELTSQVIGITDYGREIPVAVAKGNLMGVQFHPEKSGQEGLQILRNFGEMVR